jgi:general secretion pathway protein K
VSRRADRPRESGVALLVVLLAISLLTIVVVEFTYSAQVETHLALGGRNSLQAYYLARSGVNVAEAILARDVLLTGDVDSEHDIWAQPLPPLPVGDGTVMLRVRDEARALDVNVLAKEHVGDIDPARRVFQGLFRVLGLEARLLSKLIDWLDRNQEPERNPVGAEQPFYLGLTPPVAVRNGPIVALDELLAVDGMTPEILARLAPFITAIPDPERDATVRVNVNTAPTQVLRALSPTLAADTALVDEIVRKRDERAFDGPGALRDAVPRLQDTQIWQEINNQIVYKSDYFRVEAVGTVGGIARGITTVVRRGGIGRPGVVTRVSWSPRVATIALTSLPPSDFLEALPPLGGG